MDKIKALNGLRGAAALLVFISHYSKDVDLYKELFKFTGQLGVMIFFSLSAFLMNYITTNKEFTEDNVYTFYKKRFWRIIPLFTIVILFSFIYQNILRELNVGSNFLAYNYFAKFEYIYKNLLLIRGDEVFWTISVELAFYGIFPIFWLCRHKSKKVYYALIIIILAFCLHPTNQLQGVLRLANVIHFFLFGMLAFDLYESKYSKKLKPSLWDIKFIASFILLLISLPYYKGLIFTSETDSYSQFWESNFSLWLGVPLLIWSSTKSKIACVIFQNKFLMFIGKISFSFYLIHRFIQRPFTYLDNSTDLNKIVFLLLIILPITVIVSAISFQFLEKIFLKNAHSEHRLGEN